MNWSEIKESLKCRWEEIERKTILQQRMLEISYQKQKIRNTKLE